MKKWAFISCELGIGLNLVFILAIGLARSHKKAELDLSPQNQKVNVALCFRCRQIFYS